MASDTNTGTCHCSSKQKHMHTNSGKCFFQLTSVTNQFSCTCNYSCFQKYKSFRSGSWSTESHDEWYNYVSSNLGTLGEGQYLQRID